MGQHVPSPAKQHATACTPPAWKRMVARSEQHEKHAPAVASPSAAVVCSSAMRCVAMFMPRSIYMVVQKSSKSGEVCSFLAN